MSTVMEAAQALVLQTLRTSAVGAEAMDIDVGVCKQRALRTFTKTSWKKQKKAASSKG